MQYFHSTQSAQAQVTFLKYKPLHITHLISTLHWTSYTPRRSKYLTISPSVIFPSCPAELISFHYLLCSLNYSPIAFQGVP